MKSIYKSGSRPRPDCGRGRRAIRIRKMKRLKKLFGCAVALLTCLALALFCACGAESEKPDEGGVPATPTDTDNGGGTPADPSDKDDKEEGEKPANPAYPAGYKGSTPEIDEFLTTLSEQQVAGVSMDATFKGSVAYPAAIANSGYIAAEADESVTKSGVIDVSALLNLASGNADAAYSVYSGVADEEVTLNYYFLRSLDIYSAAVKAQTDGDGKLQKPDNIAGATVKYLGNITEMLESLPDKIPADTPVEIPELPALSDGAVSGAVLEMFASLGTAAVPSGFPLAVVADMFGALTVADGKAEIDLNLLAYNAVQEAAKIVNSLTAETTIAEIFTNVDFIRLVSPFVNLVTAEDIHKNFAKIAKAVTSNEKISAILGDIDLSGLDVKPDEGSTAYDYVVKIIFSDELNKTVMSCLSKVVEDLIPKLEEMYPALKDILPSLPSSSVISEMIKFTQIPISLMLGDKVTISGIKADFAKSAAGVSKTLFDTENAVMENAKICYTLGANGITGLENSGRFAGQATVENKADGQSVEYTVKYDISCAQRLQFSDTEYKLFDI